MKERVEPVKVSLSATLKEHVKTSATLKTNRIYKAMWIFMLHLNRDTSG